MLMVNSLTELAACLKHIGHLLNEALYNQPTKEACYAVQLEARQLSRSIDMTTIEEALNGFVAFLWERGIEAKSDVCQDYAMFGWQIRIRARRTPPRMPPSSAPPHGWMQLDQYILPDMRLKGWDYAPQFRKQSEEAQLLEKVRKQLPSVEVKSFEDGIKKLESLQNECTRDQHVPDQDGRDKDTGSGK